MARILQVQQYNNLMLQHSNYSMIFTTGNGSMVEKPRVRGWVVFEHPSLGDCEDFAKYFSNKNEAVNEWGVRC